MMTDAGEGDRGKISAPRAWTVDLIRELEASGDWFADKRWREPAYQANSPFSAEEHEEIFGALETLYTPSRARRVVRRQRPSGRATPRHTAPLLDPWAAHASLAVALGADLAIVRPWEVPGCRDMMNGLVRDPSNYQGARLELEVHAALLRAGVPVERGSSIDLRVRLGREPVLVEVRYVDYGDDMDREVGLLNAIMFGWGPQGRRLPGPPTWVTGRVTLLPAVRDLPEARRIALYEDEQVRRELHERVVGAAGRLAAAGGGSTVVDGIVHIDQGVAFGGNTTCSGSCPPHDAERETRRLWGVLDDKCHQVARHAEGDALVWLDIGMRLGDPWPYVSSVQQWLNNHLAVPGRRVVGVVLVAELFKPHLHETIKVLWPLRHSACDADLGDHGTWERIAKGLNWYRLRRGEWRARCSS